MSDWDDWEESVVEDFLSRYFPDDYARSDESLSDQEAQVSDALVDRVDREYSSGKGVLGLALDFLMVAEQLSHFDTRLAGFEPDIDHDAIRDRYPPGSTAATLTLTLDGESFGIRSVHEAVTDCFREDLRRTNFPSAAPHWTGEWTRFTDLLEMSFQLSRDGRYDTALRLFDMGLQRLQSRAYDIREPPFPDPFISVFEDYPRQHDDEEAGSAYQGMAYGYVKTEWPHLSLRASKLRTGSARQHRYGDIDGYYGPDLMVSVEAKDKPIHEANVGSELGTMMELAKETTAIAIAFCRSVDEEASAILEESGVHVLTDDVVLSHMATWDYHKQNDALQGMIHFLTNVEENPAATQRLLKFLWNVDPRNPAIAHLEEDGSVQSQLD